MLLDTPAIGEGGQRVRHGGCVCGRVRFTVVGEPWRVGICHCRLCRKFSGSAFVFFADYPPEAFSSTGATRNHEGRSFCPTCGSRLFHLSKTQAEIMVGALDDVPSDFEPVVECWNKRREHWLSPLPGIRQAEENP